MPYLSVLKLFVLAFFLSNAFTLKTAALEGENLVDQLWHDYDKLLLKYVSVAEREGIVSHLVDYDGLAKNLEFANLVEKVKTFPVDKLESKHEKLAFYINLYNILTIQLILDHKPKESIKEIGSFFSGPWDQVVLTNQLGELTLNNIEHDIIRPLGDPRIHFAVNCASLSCPDIRMQAYRSELIDDQLKEQSKTFLNQRDKGFRETKGNAYLSSIFSWYGKDFEASGGVENFIQSFRPKAKIKDQSYMKYNWSLNKL